MTGFHMKRNTGLKWVKFIILNPNSKGKKAEVKKKEFRVTYLHVL